MTPPEKIECPLCLGKGELTRAEVLDRLGMKDITRVAQLSASETFRLLQSQYRQDGEALWARFEYELAKRINEAEQPNAAKVQELEALLKVSKERSAIEIQRIRTDLEAKLRSEQSDKEDSRRKIEGYLAELFVSASAIRNSKGKCQRQPGVERLKNSASR